MGACVSGSAVNVGPLKPDFEVMSDNHEDSHWRKMAFAGPNIGVEKPFYAHRYNHCYCTLSGFGRKPLEEALEVLIGPGSVFAGIVIQFGAGVIFIEIACGESLLVSVKHPETYRDYEFHHVFSTKRSDTQELHAFVSSLDDDPDISFYLQ